MSEHSITRWISLLKSGDHDAANRIWERYFGLICSYAKTKLGTDARRGQDEEDLANSAIFAMYSGAMEGRFNKLQNRDDLWQILTMIVDRKSSNTHRRLGVRREIGECDLGLSGSSPRALENLPAGEPTLEDFDFLGIHCDELLAILNDKLRGIALLKLSGYTNEEIAALRDRSLSTIERYLQMIRQIWNEATSDDEK